VFWVGSEGEQLPEPKITADEALAIVLETFPEWKEKAHPEEEPQLVPGPSGSAWSVQWYVTVGDWEDTFVHVTVDAQSGEILSYNAHRFALGVPPVPMRSPEESQAVAGEWLARLLPESERAGLALTAFPGRPQRSGDQITRTFFWEREVEGYPVAFAGTAIEIDAQTGELVTFYREIPDEGVAYRLPEHLLTRSEAEVALGKALQPVLAYQYFNGEQGAEGEYRLVYRLGDFGLPMIDQEGKPFHHLQYELPVGPLSERMLPAVGKPYQPPSEAVTQEQALAVAQAAAGIPDAPDDQYFDPGSGLPEWPPTYRFTWSQPTPSGEPAWVSVEVEAGTGLVLAVNRWTDSPSGGAPSAQPPEPLEPAVSQEQAVSAAVAFVQEHRPDLIGKVALGPGPWRTSQPDSESTYSITLVPVHNGLEVLGRGAYLEVNAMTGKVVGAQFNAILMSGDLPAPTPTVQPVQVIDLVLDHVELRAVWDRSLSPATAEYSAPALVWEATGLEGLSAVDALTGQLLDHDGRDILEQKAPPRDIAGDPHAQAIELLWWGGIVETEGGLFQPDEAVTAGEALDWLTQSLWLEHCVCSSHAAVDRHVIEALISSPHALAFQSALLHGILKPEEVTGEAQLDSPISREQFALWLVRALGHERVALMETRIPMPFVDADQVQPAYANAVAILAGMGIAKGYPDGRFLPQAPLTRGEAAGLILQVAREMQRP